MPTAPRTSPLRTATALLLVMVVVVAPWMTRSALGGPTGSPQATAATTSTGAVADGTDGTGEDGITDEQAAAAGAEMTPLKAAVLGLVEGITEYLPVSSTGHLLVAQRMMDIGTTDDTKAVADSYAIAIQAGAILAVLLLYHRRIAAMVRGLFGRDEEGRAVLIGAVLAVLPAVVVSLAFEDVIKDVLLGAWPVVAAWIVGGVAILTIGVRLERRTGGVELASITPRQALIIGLVQCLALWPGTSRSLVTILAALAVGLSLAAAVEFSFLLGLVTLGGATAYETIGNGGDMVAAYGLLDPLIGLVVAFVSAAVAIRWMVGYLQRHSLALFGWYRIGVGVTVGALLLVGAI